MKCPKCNYLAFESGDRCRNCGFEFSLAASGDPASDAPLRHEPPAGPAGDFDLGDITGPPRVTPGSRAAKRRQDPTLDPRVTPAVGADLPLFGPVLPEDERPLVPPTAPGAPLAVRRATPTRPKLATPARGPERQIDPALPLDSGAGAMPPGPRPALPVEAADLGRRIGAAGLDWLMLLALDALVLYFTLRVSRLSPAEIAILPWIPMAVFLLLLNGGYLALFTAVTGQTIGKMAVGVRVVPIGEGPLTLGRTLVRVAALLVSALPAGVGLLPVLFDRARRGLHDRLAGTRVVRVAAS